MTRTAAILLTASGALAAGAIAVYLVICQVDPVADLAIGTAPPRMGPERFHREPAAPSHRPKPIPALGSAEGGDRELNHNSHRPAEMGRAVGTPRQPDFGTRIQRQSPGSASGSLGSVPGSLGSQSGSLGSQSGSLGSKAESPGSVSGSSEPSPMNNGHYRRDSLTSPTAAQPRPRKWRSTFTPEEERFRQQIGVQAYINLQHEWATGQKRE